MTTGRRLDSYNTGVSTRAYSSPNRADHPLYLSPEDAARLRVSPEERVRVSSRRGSIETEVAVDPGLRPGLAFMTLHAPDRADANVLTIDAADPKAGTARFKATPVRGEKLSAAARSPGCTSSATARAAPARAPARRGRPRTSTRRRRS